MKKDVTISLFNTRTLSFSLSFCFYLSLIIHLVIKHNLLNTTVFKLYIHFSKKRSLKSMKKSYFRFTISEYYHFNTFTRIKRAFKSSSLNDCSVGARITGLQQHAPHPSSCRSEMSLDACMCAKGCMPTRECARHVISFKL